MRSTMLDLKWLAGWINRLHRQNDVGKLSTSTSHTQRPCHQNVVIDVLFEVCISLRREYELDETDVGYRFVVSAAYGIGLDSYGRLKD